MIARLLTLVALGLACSRPAAAQGVAARLGAGPARAGEFGGAALLAVELHVQRVVVRGELRGVTAGAHAEMLFGGGAAGLVLSPPGSRLRTYLLASVNEGLDLREADYATTFGVVAGLEGDHAVGWFTELRFDGLWQHGVSYNDLPRGHLSAVIGLRMGAR